MYPLAKANNYIKCGSRYFLSGKGYLALPGCSTDNPNNGADKYNHYLIVNYIPRSEKQGQTRWNNFVNRRAKNWRLIKIRNMISNNTTEPNLSKIESFLIFKLLAK